MPKLSHYSKRGEVQMVDVSAKQITARTARAHAFVKMKSRVVAAVRRLKNPKGNPLEVARIAGIAAAKRTAEWIPLCHPLPLTHIDVTARPSQSTTWAKPSIRGWKSRTSFSPRRPAGRAGTSIGGRLRKGARDEHGSAQNGKAAAGG